MDAPDLKRKRTFRQQGSRKNMKVSDEDEGSTALKKGFGAKMLAKMGWKDGMGLGRDESGRVAPIQVQLRPSGVGLGAVKEKSDSDRREEKARAQREGRAYEDSSEEERKKKKKKERTANAGLAGARSTTQPRVRYDIEGLHVPPSLSSFVDATTNQVGQVSSLSLRGGFVADTSTPAHRIQRDYNSFVASFSDLNVESKEIEQHQVQIQSELQELELRVADNKAIVSHLSSLRDRHTLDGIVDGLVSLHKEYPKTTLSRETVALIAGPFRDCCQAWVSLENSLADVAHSLRKMEPLFDRMTSTRDPYTFEDPLSWTCHPHYCSLIEKLWWPRVASLLAQVSDLDQSSSPIISLAETWKRVLPPFIYDRFIRTLSAKLEHTITAWNTRKHPEFLSTVLGYSPILGTYLVHLLQSLSGGIGSLIRHWNLSKGVPPGLAVYAQLAGDKFLRIAVRYLLPILGNRLADFEVDPSDQVLEPLLEVLAWKDILPSEYVGELIAARVMPQLLATLHLWLTTENWDSGEVREWLNWWIDKVLGKELYETKAVHSHFERCYELINAALDLVEQSRPPTDLPFPTMESIQPPQETPKPERLAREPPQTIRNEPEELTFRDVVESWCGDENLLLIPLREAHESTGLPLFRITASALGKGGVVVYLKGDVVYAQNKKNRSMFEPIGLEEGLVSRAEGK